MAPYSTGLLGNQFFWKGPSASEKRRREIIYPCASNFQFQLSKRPAQPVSWRCRSHGSLDERFCPHREGGHPSRRKKSSGEEILWHSARRKTRSEEHTSELQSLTNLVCRLLLEKKKTK